MDERMKIGEVADRVGLSLRTIRFYEEAGLITPDARSAGGFRLYSDVTVERLKLIKAMKPLDFTVEEIAGILVSLDLLDDDGSSQEARRGAVEQVVAVRDVVDERLSRLLERAERAREFASMLDDVRARHDD
ncbi:MerR family transcriptional regulator [Aeromicrobium sp. CF4.19]|uniref:MerR family transcriptional regulator n=1 Tax=Aeromicrobium sp. CF4.19 TaxID=3373082 RepID=UPI003EE6FDE3